MEKLRKKVIAFAIWLAVLGGVVSAYVFFWAGSRKFTQEDHYLAGDEVVYVTDNTLGYGMIYSLDAETREVKKLLPTRGQQFVNRWVFEGIAGESDTAEGQEKCIYALLSKPNAYEEQTTYRIACYSEGLAERMVSRSYLLDEGIHITGFSKEKEEFCITAVSEDRQRIIFYKLRTDELVDIKQLDDATRQSLKGEPEKEDPDSDDQSAGGRYAEAVLAGSKLYTRMEGELPEGYFAENTDVQGLFDSRQMSLLQHYIEAGCSAIVLLVIYLLGCGLLWVVIDLRSLQYRFVNRMLFYELFLGALMAVLFVVLLTAMSISYSNIFNRFAMFALDSIDEEKVDFEERPDVYDTKAYKGLLSDMEMIAKDEDGVISCMDICFVQESTGEVVASLRGYTGHTLTYCYGQESSRAIQETDDVVRTAEYMLISHPVTGKANFTAIFVARNPSIINYIRQYGFYVPWLLGAAYLALSLAGILTILRESKDLRMITNVLRELAEGKTTYQKPDKFLGWEMERLWNNVNEICRNILSINRIQFLTYKAYYRFAPKSIEHILKKESITDVNCGDEIRLNGTIAMVSSRQIGSLQTNKEGTNTFLELIDKHREEKEGIFISSAPDLSTVRLLFLEESGGSVNFGVDLQREAHSARKAGIMPRVSILIHYLPIVYGIAGTDNQATAYVSMNKEKLFEAFAEWFGRMGLSLVVTDSVRKHEQNIGDLRHIGFILPEKNDPSQRIQLYEVLDAEPTGIHTGKQKTMKIFEEGLSLFYRRDFYLARGSFAEILRQMPEDGVAKWYLFECERWLNDEEDSGFVGNLRFR